MLILYSIAIFVNAALLFLVQPMFARLVLPLLGGSPAVWNTSLVFFQAALLAGYAYAHASSRWLGVRRQAGLHLVLLLLPLFVLPIAVPAGWEPPAESNPIPWLLALLFTAVGLPFFVVSAGSPLLQKWFASSGHKTANDPYFLYAASNLGSMLALLAYPVFIEPHLHLPNQSRWWSVAYYMLMALTVLCAVSIWKLLPATAASVEGNEANQAVIAPAARLPWKRVARWVLLALVPSSQMVSVTTYLTTDIAAIPLLWIIPLSVYLLTFIVAFARRPWLPQIFWARALPIVMLPLIIAMAARANHPFTILVPLHLLGLLVVAMACHGALAEDRPPASYLTEFYLWISVGGVLGGAFNALLAPVIFKTVVEYPLTLVLACLLGVRPDKTRTDINSADANGEAPREATVESRKRTFDVALPAVVLVVTAVLILVLQARGLKEGPQALALMFGLPALFAFSFSRRPLRFALAVGAILLASSLFYRGGLESRVLLCERSFFGVHRVTIDAQERFRLLMHGNTLHGLESLDPARRGEPLSYYTRSGPIGDVFEAVPAALPRFKNIGVVGLGAGCIAVYARPEQRWSFYEIDPIVANVASDPQYFTFLRDCRAPHTIVLGDGRLKLLSAPDGFFDLLILDAYSSDSLPVHLVTREALQLYLRKISPHGVLAFNVSNRHLDIEPVIGNLARDAGMFCLSRADDDIPAEVLSKGKTASQWMVVAQRKESLGALNNKPLWKKARTDENIGVWTDSYSSLLSVFRWE